MVAAAAYGWRIGLRGGRCFVRVDIYYNQKSQRQQNFMNSSFIKGIAIVLVAVLLGVYFIDSRSIEHKELPYDELIVDKNFYGPSEYENWHTINIRSSGRDCPAAA